MSIRQRGSGAGQESSTAAPTVVRARRRRRWRSLVGFALAAGLGVGSFVGGIPDTPPAHAASFSYGIFDSGYFLGAYAVDPGGHLAYCVEPGGETPFDVQQPVQNGTTVLRGYWTKNREHYVQPYSDPAGLRQMAYIMNTYGKHLGDVVNPDEEAAAVNLAVWMIRAEQDTWLQQNVIAQRKALGGAWVTRAEQLVAEAEQRAVAPPTTAAPQTPRVEGASAGRGTLMVHAGTTTVSVERGVFSDPGTSAVQLSADRTTATVTDGAAHTLDWEAHPSRTSTRNDGPQFRASWARSGSGWPASLNVYPPSEDMADQLLAMGEPQQVSVGGGWDIAGPVSLPFAPTITTEVETVQLHPGDSYGDRVTFGVADDIPWSRYLENGEWQYRSVVAQGTLYGPMKARPVQAQEVPTNPQIPVAATASIIADRGPGTYEVQVRGDEADEVGFYTWVWEIDAAEQGPDIQTGEPDGWHIAADYRFQDEFGIPGETHVRPMRPTIHTELADRTLPLGGSTIDRVDLQLQEGAWLEQDGARIPMTVRSTVYATDGQPERQQAAPEDARVLASQTTVVDHPVRARELTFDIDVPFRETGGVTIQTCVLADDQPAGLRDAIAEVCDDWGIPEESAVIVTPEVVTQAQPDAAVRGDMMDTAIVSGALPNSPRIEIGFTAYLRPEAGTPKFDSEWQPMLNDDGTPQVWTAEEVESAACEAQPVAMTERVAVTELGAVNSPSVRAESAGTVYWVEELFAEDPETGDEITLHRGECGLPEETTEVMLPQVHTVATPEAHPGDEIFDTAHVSGALSDRDEIEYEVTFEAFHRPTGVTDTPDPDLCTAETLVWTSSEGSPVTAPGEVESERWRIPEELRGEILWIETLWVIEAAAEDSRAQLHRGECGAEHEVTRILESEMVTEGGADTPRSDATLPSTGDTGSPWWAAAGLILIGAALFTAHWTRRIFSGSAAGTRQNHRELRESGTNSR